MENSWKTHGISLQQFGRHPDIRGVPGGHQLSINYMVDFIPIYYKHDTLGYQAVEWF